MIGRATLDSEVVQVEERGVESVQLESSMAGGASIAETRIVLKLIT